MIRHLPKSAIHHAAHNICGRATPPEYTKIREKNTTIQVRTSTTIRQHAHTHQQQSACMVTRIRRLLYHYTRATRMYVRAANFAVACVLRVVACVCAAPLVRGASLTARRHPKLQTWMAHQHPPVTAAVDTVHCVRWRMLIAPKKWLQRVLQHRQHPCDHAGQIHHPVLHWTATRVPRI